ncbi:alpha/beta-hydrolase [Setomelanomma holmii]|uniref:Alpha/beta-hydrolase n=1 Tax=Setomelanomma holmii TaxID=210430 RepID=A0A9P4H6V4_9PLEO|nr:alpha/beta-hydrolase [Setomelanomma holmii]
MRVAPLYTAASAAVIILPTSATPLIARDNSTLQYDFTNLTASATLDWKPCYENFTCAALIVPLDYANASAGNTTLDIIKKPGDTPDVQEVLVNPGGPGGQATVMVLTDYAAIQDKIGTKYALVGIDPRGTGSSGPLSDCFSGYSFVARNAFLSSTLAPIDNYHGDYVLKQSHQSMLEYGKWCSQIYSVNGTARYAGTVATAQDMLHYIQLRAKDLGKNPDDAKLWYYGISYGTILGPTFASLYPDKVERMILDGVLELEDQFNGGWESSLADSDEATRFWFKRCFEAGPQLCASSTNATSWQEIEQRFWALFNQLKDDPIGLGDPTSQTAIDLAESGVIVTPHIFTWQDLANMFFGVSYILAPVYYSYLDLILVELASGNYSQLQGLATAAQISSYAPAYDDRMARTLINCLDANGRSNYTDFEDFKGFVDFMSNGSVYNGRKIATFSGSICSQLNVFPPESQAFDGIPRIGDKKVPILFISGIADPVTPLPSAENMQTYFPGSGLLKWNNSGHCAHFQKTACVSQHEKQFMLDGTLPPANTTCEVDQPNPFLAYAEELANANSTTSGSTTGTTSRV